MKTVVLLSGGLDSLVLLARECHAGRPPLCLSFNYGQRHRRELDAAADIAALYRVAHKIVELPWMGESALTGCSVALPQDVPFDDPAQAATVVPNRNMVMLSVAASYALQHRQDTVLFAAHAGDAAVYPDCRAGFVRALNEALWLACGVHIVAPFLAMTKRDIVRMGRSYNAPLSLAWSCYEGGKEPCGRCGACIERQDAENFA